MVGDLTKDDFAKKVMEKTIAKFGRLDVLVSWLSIFAEWLITI